MFGFILANQSLPFKMQRKKQTRTFYVTRQSSFRATWSANSAFSWTGNLKYSNCVSIFRISAIRQTPKTSFPTKNPPQDEVPRHHLHPPRHFRLHTCQGTLAAMPQCVSSNTPLLFSGKKLTTGTERLLTKGLETTAGAQTVS